jgi:hypothetical protein
MSKRVGLEIRLDLMAVRAAVDPNWAAWTVFQALAEAGAPVIYLNGKIVGEDGSGFVLTRDRGVELLMDCYRASWINTPLLDDPDVIDLEVIEERLTLPAAA